MNSTNTMTLGRFVRVTFNNFRLLMRTINAPLTSPMTHSPDEAQQQPYIPTAAPSSGATGAVAPAPAMTTAKAHRDPTPEPEVRPTQADVGVAIETQLDGAHAEAEIQIDGGIEEKRTEDAPDGDAPAGDNSQDASLAQAVATGLTLPAVLESLLFVAAGPVEPGQLARACSVAPAIVEQGLLELAEHYRCAGRGLRVQERAGRYQLVTAPETGALVEAFLQVDVTSRLSGPALEALAVIAYRQPVTRAQIEAVRGVDCSGVLRSLVQRGLVEETGRLEAPGRPVLYGITDLFLHHFGLTSLQELPPLAIGEQDRIDEVLRDSAAALLSGVPITA